MQQMQARGLDVPSAAQLGWPPAEEGEAHAAQHAAPCYHGHSPEKHPQVQKKPETPRARSAAAAAAAATATMGICYQQPQRFRWTSSR